MKTLRTASSGDTPIVSVDDPRAMERSLRRNLLITQSIGEIFPENLDLSRVHTVLDLACGPGGWVLEAAFAHPDWQITGLDISEKMVNHANAQALVQGLGNAGFQVGNILQPLPFSDNSFDLINARLILGLFPADQWISLIRESLRILRPGGILCFTEAEVGFVNTPAHAQAWSTIINALYQYRIDFSSHGISFSIFPKLLQLFRKTNLRHLGRSAQSIDYSFGTEAHTGFYHHCLSAFSGVEPHLLKMGAVITADEWRTLSQKALSEMFEPEFCAAWGLLTVWGYKPE
jgi:ubiquinone/menaquinone biosynthesis C-methylase UbiE